MAKGTVFCGLLWVLSVQSSVLRNEDTPLKRESRSPHCFECHGHGFPPPPPVFHTHQWTGVERSTGGIKGVFSGAAAEAGGGSQSSGQAFSLASSGVATGLDTGLGVNGQLDANVGAGSDAGSRNSGVSRDTGKSATNTGVYDTQSSLDDKLDAGTSSGSGFGAKKDVGSHSSNIGIYETQSSFPSRLDAGNSAGSGVSSGFGAKVGAGRNSGFNIGAGADYGNGVATGTGTSYEVSDTQSSLKLGGKFNAGAGKSFGSNANGNTANADSTYDTDRWTGSNTDVSDTKPSRGDTLNGISSKQIDSGFGENVNAASVDRSSANGGHKAGFSSGTGAHNGNSVSQTQSSQSFRSQYSTGYGGHVSRDYDGHGSSGYGNSGGSDRDNLKNNKDSHYTYGSSKQYGEGRGDYQAGHQNEYGWNAEQTQPGFGVESSAKGHRTSYGRSSGTRDNLNQSYESGTSQGHVGQAEKLNVNEGSFSNQLQSSQIESQRVGGNLNRGYGTGSSRGHVGQIKKSNVDEGLNKLQSSQIESQSVAGSKHQTQSSTNGGGNWELGSGYNSNSASQQIDRGTSAALSGALDLASQGVRAAQQAQPSGCGTCGKGSYALSNAKSDSGDAIAVSIGG